MKKHIIAVIFTAILVGSFNNGCAESIQDISTIPTMQPTRFDGNHGDCTNGGVKIEVLIDGVVDESQTQYICDGAQGQGGTSTNIKTTKFDGAQGDCANGGVKIEVLLNGMVDDTQTQYLCNGAQGQDGQDGQNGQDGQSGQNGTQFTIQTTQFDGAQGDCTDGGVKIEVLVNGVVDDTQTQYICNGAQGQTGQGGTSTNIKTTQFDGTQGDCTNGGVKIEVLVNGTVDDTQTQYICNGTQGENGQSGTSTTMKTTKFDDAQGDCTNGGVKIEVLVNGTVDDTQTQYICNGTQGENGENGQSGTSSTIQTTKFDGAQGDCTNGGVKIEVLVNGVVDSTQTQYICNSAAQGGIFCSGLYIDVMNDSANCGSCGNVCQAGYECINGTCKPFSDFSASTTIICNGETLAPYKNRDNCNGCGIGCGDKNICLEGSCVPLGTIITFGHYEQDNDDTNGREPIEWRILDQNAAYQYLVISDKVLEKKKYNETNKTITWEKSTIRSWLNGYAASYNSGGKDYTSNNFIDAAFTAEEQAKIVASNVPAHANPYCITKPGNATTDKIFLLSIVEAEQYFANDTARLGNATRYAVKQGLSVRGTDTVSTSGGTSSSNGTCASVYCFTKWWLRSPGIESYDSPGSYSFYAAGVYDSGSVSAIGLNASGNSNDHGVRPALWLDY